MENSDKVDIKEALEEFLIYAPFKATALNSSRDHYLDPSNMIDKIRKIGVASANINPLKLNFFMSSLWVKM